MGGGRGNRRSGNNGSDNHSHLICIPLSHQPSEHLSSSYSINEKKPLPAVRRQVFSFFTLLEKKRNSSALQFPLFD
ncbi:hypothetical protein IMY05_004G0172100 [Salix suchowensis]|nr:hypothetical protein IMY05_004G0172100 [Salix suchowensis]